jgi:hypothetical protein
MKGRIFIQSNAKQLLGAKVAAHALKRNSRTPERFDVEIIRVEEQATLFGRNGQPYLREGKIAHWKNDDLQSFTPTRFMPPMLMGYEGRALVIDPDVFAVGDVAQLLERDMHGKAILCRRIPATAERAAYWASSVMLLDCTRLRHWRWHEDIAAMFEQRRDYRAWVSLELEPQDSIGELEQEWNDYDRLTSATKLLHTTGRRTQPWKTGLPIDFVQAPESGGTALRARRAVGRLLRDLRARLKGTAPPAAGVYLKHPDPAQERLFFDLLQECLDSGSISSSELHAEIELKHVRPDAFDLLVVR